MRVCLPLVAFLALSGCVLPIPHKRLHAFGATGQVVDARTRAPIGGASVSAADKPDEVVTTDQGGWFTIQPVTGWHGAYLIAPISLSIFPAMDMPAIQREILVAKHGYQDRKFVFFVHDFAKKIAGPQTILLERK